MIACDEETGPVSDSAPEWTEEQRYAIEHRYDVLVTMDPV